MNASNQVPTVGTLPLPAISTNLLVADTLQDTHALVPSPSINLPDTTTLTALLAIVAEKYIHRWAIDELYKDSEAKGRNHAYIAESIVKDMTTSILMQFLPVELDWVQVSIEWNSGYGFNLNLFWNVPEEKLNTIAAQLNSKWEYIERDENYTVVNITHPQYKAACDALTKKLYPMVDRYCSELFQKDAQNDWPNKKGIVYYGNKAQLLSLLASCGDSEADRKARFSIEAELMNYA
jgi:hypothetical protein